MELIVAGQCDEQVGIIIQHRDTFPNSDLRHGGAVSQQLHLHQLPVSDTPFRLFALYTLL